MYGFLFTSTYLEIMIERNNNYYFSNCFYYKWSNDLPLNIYFRSNNKMKRSRTVFSIVPFFSATKSTVSHHRICGHNNTIKNRLYSYHIVSPYLTHF